MPTVSRARLLLGGLIAGMTIDAVEYLLDSFVFSENWEAVAGILHQMPPSPNPPPAPPPSNPAATLLLFILQAAGLAAGLLAVWFYASRSRGRPARPLAGALCAWVIAYAPVCAALVLINRRAPDSADPPLTVPGLIAFALSALLACQCGAALGAWVYRESVNAAASSPAEV